ncbi:MAG: hypothetical protein ACLS3C_03415 [Oscillospiraceae bacterium]
MRLRKAAAYLADWNDREKSREVSDARSLQRSRRLSRPTRSGTSSTTANSSQRSPSGRSAATAGLTTSASAASTTSWRRIRTSTCSFLDTEVYSNTGGQSSKATPTSATAKFAASGKKVAKKDLGAILMQYEYVYVAQVAMGADQAQTLKALREAESYDGPSIVICYCPCLEQHIKAGMGTSQDEMKKAVECGYWHLYRYDPRRIAEGKNPFQLDSKEPDTDKVMDFLMGENRFASLKNNFPDKADALYAKEVEDVKARYRLQEARGGTNLLQKPAVSPSKHEILYPPITIPPFSAPDSLAIPGTESSIPPLNIYSLIQ